MYAIRSEQLNNKEKKKKKRNKKEKRKEKKLKTEQNKQRVDAKKGSHYFQMKQMNSKMFFIRMLNDI